MSWILLVLHLLLTASVFAQLSPGSLSEAHASLEGVKNCTLCHELARAVSNDHCLACHVELNRRIQAGRGFHGVSVSPDTSCASCHSEHNGREYELVYWGQEGVEAFDHEATGHSHVGKHAEQTCHDCHREEWFDTALLADTTVNPERSFLGLKLACTSCHSEEHQGQFGEDCTVCHTRDAWHPTSFLHDTTSFPLLGEHLKAGCDGCHPKKNDRRSADLKIDFAGSPGWYFEYRREQDTSCDCCHENPHRNQLGATCSECHSPLGWSGTTKQFDHTLTGYQLEGTHQQLSCKKCHQQGLTTRWSGGGCNDCHEDEHCGQFVDDAGHTNCSLCHEQHSFRQHSFSLERHQQTSMPLEGAHAAIPCSKCHTRDSSTSCADYNLDHADCDACHPDPHGGRAQRWGTAGCRSCHMPGELSLRSFDHSGTRFPLSGKHQHVACGDCHQSTIQQGQLYVPLRPLSQECSACHEDTHGGQFASKGATNCARCHSTTGWQQSTFDHNRQTRFPIDGAHVDLACIACHQTEVFPDGERRIRYRKTPRECRACHDAHVSQEASDD